MTDAPRDAIAQQPPSSSLDLASYPVRQLAEGTSWWRAHLAAHGPWWFASAGAGRFDLAPPRGTCYLASSVDAAAREAIGTVFARCGWVTADLVDGRIVDELALPVTVSAASLTDSRSFEFGVVGNELASGCPYAVAQQWAAAFEAAGFDAIWYRPRFSSSTARAIALFGDAGERRDWQLHPRTTLPLREVVDSLGVRVLELPASLAELDVREAPIDEA